jgi:hypothetical protein
VNRLVVIPPDTFRRSADALDVSVANVEEFVRAHAPERVGATPLER